MLNHVCSLNNKHFGKYVPAFINNVPISALVDSGNTAGNCISWKFAKQLGLRVEDLEQIPQPIHTAKKGAELQVMGRPKSKLKLRLGGLQESYKIKPYVIRDLTSNVNISLPFLEKHNIDQIHSCKSLKVKGKLIRLHGQRGEFGVQEVHKNSSTSKAIKNTVRLPKFNLAYVNEDVEIQPNSSAFIKLRIPNLEQQQLCERTGTLTATEQFVKKFDLIPSRQAVVKVTKHGTTHSAVLNMSDECIIIPKNAQFGLYEDLSSMLDKSNKREFRKLDWSKSKIIQKFGLDKSPILKSKTDINRAVDLLTQFGDLFSDDPNNFGTTDLIEHTIDTSNNEPIKHKCRPFNPDVQKQLEEQLDIWIEKDIIEEANSPWSARLLPVPKKNGKIRWCVDYRGLNKLTKKDSFPLPNMEECLTRMSHSKVFSAIDGTGAYHVVKLSPKDKEKTAFSCHKGQFQFKRMPFGLTNAPATYSRLVQKVLEGLDTKYVTAFLDDISCFTPSLDEHFRTLQEVFTVQRAAGLTLNPEKCQLFKPEI